MPGRSGYTTEVYKDAAGEFRWRLVAANGQIVATSHDGYVKRSHALSMVGKIFGDSKTVRTKKI